MKYYVIYKTDKKSTLDALPVLEGYTFKQKIRITLYNRDMTQYILEKKVNKSLRAIIDLYLLYESDDDEENGDARRDALIPKIETLKNNLLGKYAYYMPVHEITNYIDKLEKLERKLGTAKSQKSRSR